MQKENPDHLPDIQKEGAKIVEMNSRINLEMMSPKRRISAMNAKSIQEQSKGWFHSHGEPEANEEAAGAGT